MLRNRIILITILCVLITGLPLAFTYNRLVEKENASQMIHLHTVQFDSSSSAVESLFYEARRLALVTASDYRIMRASSLPELATTEQKRLAMDAFTTMSNYLATSRISDEVETFIVCNGSGLQIASGNSRKSSSVSDGVLAMQRITGKEVTAVFTYTDSLDRSHQVIALALPLDSSSRSYLYMELSANLLEPLFSIETPYIQNGIMEKDGTFRFLKEDIPSPESWTEAYDEKVPVRKNGHDYLSALYTTSQCDFSLVSFLDYTVLAGKKSSLAFTIFFIAAVLILLSFLLGILLTGQIDRPVQRVIAHIKRLQAHDFTPDPSIETGSTEFAEIGKTLNGMTVEINKLMTETEQMYKEKQKQEIALLQSQVNPHFLYNTLESINMMAHIQRNTGIEKMTKSLVVLLKNLAKGTGDIITLGEECALVEEYVSIQKISMIDAFDYIDNISEELKKECRVRKFTLQPIIENAISHGVGTSETKNGLIILDGRTEDDALILTVTDNGVGMDEETAGSLLAVERKGRMTGMGIFNVNKRIQLNFGSAYGLSIQSAIGKGTTVTIRLPRRIDA